MSSNSSYTNAKKPDLASGYRHVFETRARYDDIDTFGHVNNKSYMSYLEDARIDYYRVVLGIDVRTLQLPAVVRKSEIAYESPDFEAVITRTDASGNESLAATSLTTMVAVDAENGEPKEWAASSTKAIEAFETVAPRCTGANRGDALGDRGAGIA